MTEDRMNRNLDAALAAWARDDQGDDAAVARLVAHADLTAAKAPSARPGRRWVPWAAGGSALAASVAVALLLQSGQMGPGSTETAAIQATSVEQAQFAGRESFALLYTPTADEEAYL